MSQRVVELWRYPVKSLGGERLAAAKITELGIEGDRGWGIRDLAVEDERAVLTARRAPELLFASARLVAADEVAITLPDGSETADDGVLSRWLGREVALVRATDEGATYENPMDVENDAEWVSWTGPGGALHDSTRTRVSLVGTETLGGYDVRRFRPNVVLSGGGEDALVGRRLSLGTAELDLTKQIDRCVMVTRPQPGLERDLGVLTSVIAERDNLLAVGALVAEPGRVVLGDELRDGSGPASAPPQSSL